MLSTSYSLKFTLPLHCCTNLVLLYSMCTYITLLYSVHFSPLFDSSKWRPMLLPCVYYYTEVWLWNINKILTSPLFVPFVQNSNIRNDLILSMNYDFHFITFIKFQYLNLTIASYLRNRRSSRTIQTRLVLHHLDRLFLDWLNKILSPGFWNEK